MLPDIFDVASDLVINRDTVDDFLVIMKPGIAVTTKVLTDDRAKNVWLADHTQVSIWRIKGGPKIAWRGDVDCLGGAICWANAIKLQVASPAIISRRCSIHVVNPRGAIDIVVHEIIPRGAEVSGKVNLGVNALPDCDRTADVAVDHNRHVGFGRFARVGKQRKDILAIDRESTA